MKIRSFIFLAVGFLPLAAFSFDVVGHVIVAKIAYDNTTPAARAKLAALCPELRCKNNHYTAVSLAGWPDHIKHDEDPNNPYGEQFGAWHFLDIGLKPTDPNPLDDLDKLTAKSGDVLQGITLCQQLIATKQTNKIIRSEAVALALLVHLVGDLHQPLHCTTNFLSAGGNGKKTRTDAGGNSVDITNFTNRYPELHQFWDVGYKLKFNPSTGKVAVDAGWDWSYPEDKITPKTQQLVAFTTMLTTQTPRPQVDLTGNYLLAWINETHDVGVKVAYGALKQDYTKDITVDAQYTDLVRRTTQYQMTLAGYRLAAILAKLYP